MHEFSIVLNIVEIAEKEARIAGAHRISAISLEIGRLSSIEPAAFRFAWKQAVRGSMLEHARCTIRYLPGEAACTGCGLVFEIKQLYEPCPGCGLFGPEIRQGQSLRVCSLRLEDEPAFSLHPNEAAAEPLTQPVAASKPSPKKV